jgi:hypothetical protein
LRTRQRLASSGRTPEVRHGEQVLSRPDNVAKQRSDGARLEVYGGQSGGGQRDLFWPVLAAAGLGEFRAGAVLE